MQQVTLLQGFTCVWEGGKSSLSLMPSPSGDHICASKSQRKKDPDTQELVGYAISPSRSQQLKKWCYITDKAHSHSPLGSQVESRVLSHWRKRGEWEKRALCGCYGIRGEWQKEKEEEVCGKQHWSMPSDRGDEGTPSLSKETNVRRDGKRPVWIEMSLLIIMHEALWESRFKRKRASHFTPFLPGKNKAGGKGIQAPRHHQVSERGWWIKEWKEKLTGEQH